MYLLGCGCSPGRNRNANSRPASPGGLWVRAGAKGLPERALWRYEFDMKFKARAM